MSFDVKSAEEFAADNQRIPPTFLNVLRPPSTIHANGPTFAPNLRFFLRVLQARRSNSLRFLLRVLKARRSILRCKFFLRILQPLRSIHRFILESTRTTSSAIARRVLQPGRSIHRLIFKSPRTTYSANARRVLHASTSASLGLGFLIFLSRCSGY